MCISPIKLNNNDIPVPCGKCYECRNSRRRDWSIRLTEESRDHNDGWFITLTYSDQCLPKNGLLNKRDLTLFIKKIREAVRPNRIKYYAVGEYGERTLRPHYHLIVFSLGDNQEEVLKMVADKWNFGQVQVGFCTPKSINYVTKYLLKYQSGKESFSVMSKNLGIGYIKRTREYHECIGNAHYVYPNGYKTKLPRYYLNRLYTEGQREAIRGLMQDDLDIKMLDDMQKQADKYFSNRDRKVRLSYTKQKDSLKERKL